VSKSIEARSVKAFLIVLSVAVFDVLVIEGWAASICILCWAIFVVLRSGTDISRKKSAAALGFGSVLLTTLLGYASAQYVYDDFSRVAHQLKGRPPASKSEFLALGSGLSWLTKYSLLSYTAATPIAVARFRVFPYRIEEYDFKGQRTREGAYDQCCANASDARGDLRDIRYKRYRNERIKQGCI